MADGIDNIHRIKALAKVNGLVPRGWFDIEESDAFPAQESGKAYAVLLLFGQSGSAVWHGFARSPEYADGEANPMDRWSYRIGSSLAGELGGKALFPFEGPPWHPFGQWAQRAESIRSSPLGILLHPEYGLWHAYRFAIALPAPIEGLDELEICRDGQTSIPHACDRCQDRPCLTTCPVKAFTDGAYDVASCTTYLRENEQADCHRLGCLARAACPESSTFAYEPAHRQFHMRQFYAAFRKPSGK